ncbi:acyl-CoA dehydrogenase family protein [Verminephrobacter eiseniae]|uniref:acyl-CoA dehydrogenase family protein n=1 Tax=Verminephrobacter eiseniae TaxID=364317 RepID=UPI0022381687|nr:acyl-CoA dehydrogenase family protein [Verminephrobacter eiseniae]MCW5235381.1 acyl-CoA dehydrogenase [Verminephrobacter eiseniae]
MIDFCCGQELQSMLDTAARFAQERLWPAQRDFEQQRGVPEPVQQLARAIGFDRIDWPEASGGAGMGALARVLVSEQLAAGCPGAALALQPLGSVAQALLAFGGAAALRAHVLPLLDRPGARALLVFDPRQPWHSQAQGAGVALSGTLPWLPTDRVDLLALLGRTGLQLVTRGIDLVPVPGAGLQAAGASQVRLQCAPVDAAWHDPGAAALALAHARVQLAALLVGQMHAAAEYARRYALERVAFGRPIAHHQALAFLIVDMRSAVDAARLLLHEAAWRLDAGQPAGAAAATALIEAVENAVFIGANAVQILGAAGFMRDHPVEKQLRELRALGLLLGGADAAREDALGVGGTASDAAPWAPIAFLADAAQGA